MSSSLAGAQTAVCRRRKLDRGSFCRLHLAVLLVFAFVLVSVAAQSPAPAPHSAVDRVFAEWNRPDSPGCSVGIARNGAVVYERGYGVANLETATPITPATVFHVASISKQFTAMSILLLASRGRLSLDDEVWRHVPEWVDRQDRITIRHLLSHTAGLRDAFLLVELAPPDVTGATRNEAVTRVAARQRGLNFTAGTEFEYSNAGYALLAEIVRRVSGQSLRSFADANIFHPLGMTSTHVHDNPAMLVPNRATGYHRIANGFDLALHADLGRLVGTTGVFTTTRDLLRWEDNFVNTRVGDGALVAAMQTPPVLADGKKSPYGLGLWIGEDRGIPTVEHGGGDPGYRAYVARYPEQNLAIAVLCNLDDVDPGALTRKVLERDSSLVITIPGRSDIRLEPLVPDTFHGPLIDVVKFSRDARGVVSGLSVHAAGIRDLPFRRVGTKN